MAKIPADYWENDHSLLTHTAAYWKRIEQEVFEDNARHGTAPEVAYPRNADKRERYRRYLEQRKEQA